MTQLISGIGVAVVAIAVIVLIYWIWTTWFKTSTIGQTTTGTVVSAAFDSAQLTLNLGYIELLSKIDVVKASPDAVKACDVLADALWQGAIAAWKTAQVAAIATTPAVVAKTAKVTTTDGTVVEVPVQ